MLSYQRFSIGHKTYTLYPQSFSEALLIEVVTGLALWLTSHDIINTLVLIN